MISIFAEQLTRKGLKPRRQADSPDESPEESPVFTRQSPERARRHPRAEMRILPKSLDFTRATPEEMASH